LRPKFERLAADLGLRAQVTFQGQVPGGAAVRRHLDASDLFVLPSRTEGLPRAMVEAMARALPCIGTKVGGVPELLPPADLVPVDDVDALARKTYEVLSSPSRMQEMSVRNLSRANDFADENLASRRLEFLAHVRHATSAWLKKSRPAGDCLKREAPVW